MDHIRCSLCGTLLQPEYEHFCNLEEDYNLFSESERDKLLESVPISRNIGSEGIPDPGTDGEPSCLFEHERNNNFSRPDKSSLPIPPVPIQLDGNPLDVSTSFSFDNSLPSGNQSLNPRIAQGKEFVCDVCGKGFTVRSNLKRHVRSHTNVKPFTCDQCGKTYSQRSSLMRHLESHTNEEQYKCDQCGKGFSTPRKLKRHHGVSHPGPYKCIWCDRTFSKKPYLRRHFRKHPKENPNTCDQCGKEFSDNSSLRLHNRTHTKVKPFGCDHCSKAFSERSLLKAHLSTHSEVKPYVCNLCDKGYSLNSTLKRHLETHKVNKVSS